MSDFLKKQKSPILTKEEFSDSSGYSLRAIEQMIKEGALPVVQLTKRRIAINVAVLTEKCLEQSSEFAGFNK